MRSALFEAASWIRPMVLVMVALVSRKTGATLQAVSQSVSMSRICVVLSGEQDRPATLTLGSHDLAMIA